MQRGLGEGVDGEKHSAVTMVRNRESAGITGAGWSTDRLLRHTEKTQRTLYLWLDMKVEGEIRGTANVDMDRCLGRVCKVLVTTLAGLSLDIG